MAKALKIVGAVAAVVAIVATAGAALAPAVAATATSAATAGGFLGISAATLGTIGAVAGLVAATAGLAAQALAPKPSFSAGGNPLDFQTNPQSGLPYAIGRTRMSGLKIYGETYDAPGVKSEGKDDELAFAVLLNAVRSHSIEKFTADNEEVEFDDVGNAIGRYHDRMGQVVSLGLPGAAALVLSFGGLTTPGWTADHKLSDMTHALWTLQYDEKGNVYGAGVTEPAWIGKWALAYDPRKDSTYPGGSGSHRALDETTYEWTRNPALHALTWALGRWQNGKKKLGIGAPIQNIRMSEFVEAANVADTNEWFCGGVEWSTDTKWATLKRILQAGGAEPTMTGAMIGCRVNTPRVSITTITGADLLEAASFPTTKSRRDRFNTVIPRYRSEDHDWEVVSGTEISVPAYVTEDNGKRTKEIDFPLVQNEVGQGFDGNAQAGQLAAYEIVNSREAGPWRVTVGPEFIGIKTGDVFTLDVPDEGIASQPVLVRSRSIDPATFKITFEVETETAAKHDFALGRTTTPPPSYSPTPPDLTPPTPSASLWTLTEGATADGVPALIVAGTCEFPGADTVLIEYRKIGDGEWISRGRFNASAPITHFISPVDGASDYKARVSYASGDRFGDWLELTTVITPPFEANPIVATLSPAEMSLPASTGGTILSYDGANFVFEALQGTTNISSSFSLAVVANPQALDVTIAGQTVSVTGGFGTDEPVATLDLSATGGGAWTGATFYRTARLTKIREAFDASGEIDDLQDQIDTLEGDFTTFEASASSDIAALESLSASLQDQADALAADVDTLFDDVLANATDISTLETTVATQGSQISTLAASYTSLSGSVATLTTKVSAGARNLIKNSGFENGLTNWSPTGAWSSGASAWGNLAYSTGTGTIFIATDEMPVIAGASYTLSGDMEFQGASSGSAYILIVWYNSSHATISSVPSALKTPGPFTTNLDGRLRVTATAPSTAVYARAFAVGDTLTGTPYLAVREMKFELGSQMSPFTQEASVVQTFSALATLDTQYASLSSTVSTQGSLITTNATAITTLNTNVASLSSTVSTQGASIATNASAITTLNTNYATLSSTVATQGSAITTNASAISTINSNLATLTTQVSSSNANLLPNGSFEDGGTNWTLMAGVSPAPNASNVWGPAAEYFGSLTTLSVAAYSDLISVTPGQPYTVAADMRLIASSTAAYCYVDVTYYASDGTTVLLDGTQQLFSANADFSPDMAARRALTYATDTAPTGAAFASVRWVINPNGATVTAAGLRLVKFERSSTWSHYTAEASVTQVFQSLTTLDSSYASLSSTVSTQGSQIATNATAITTLNSNYATLASTVSTQGASITSNATAISTLNTDVATLESTVSTQGSSITSQAGAIDDLEGKTVAWLEVVGVAGDSEFALRFLADGFSGSLAEIQADAIRLGSSNAPAIDISGGDVIFYGKVTAESIETEHLSIGGVSTDRIAANAVTILGTAYTSGSTVSTSAVYANIQSYFYTSTGAPTQISICTLHKTVTGTSDASMWLRVLRNGTTVVWEAPTPIISPLAYATCFSFQFLDPSPPAGVVTYELQGKCQTTSWVEFSARSVTPQEVKR